MIYLTECQSLIQSLLNVNVQARFDIVQALNHAWNCQTCVKPPQPNTQPPLHANATNKKPAKTHIHNNVVNNAVPNAWNPFHSPDLLSNFKISSPDPPKRVNHPTNKFSNQFQCKAICNDDPAIIVAITQHRSVKSKNRISNKICNPFKSQNQWKVGNIQTPADSSAQKTSQFGHTNTNIQHNVAHNTVPNTCKPFQSPDLLRCLKMYSPVPLKPTNSPAIKSSTQFQCKTIAKDDPAIIVAIKQDKNDKNKDKTSNASLNPFMSKFQGKVSNNLTPDHSPAQKTSQLIGHTNTNIQHNVANNTVPNAWNPFQSPNLLSCLKISSPDLPKSANPVPRKIKANKDVVKVVVPILKCSKHQNSKNAKSFNTTWPPCNSQNNWEDSSSSGNTSPQKNPQIKHSTMANISSINHWNPWSSQLKWDIGGMSNTVFTSTIQKKSSMTSAALPRIII